MYKYKAKLVLLPEILLYLFQINLEERITDIDKYSFYIMKYT